MTLMTFPISAVVDQPAQTDSHRQADGSATFSCLRDDCATTNDHV